MGMQTRRVRGQDASAEGGADKADKEVISWNFVWFFQDLEQRFSNFFQMGTTFISQNILRTILLLGLSNSLGLP